MIFNGSMEWLPKKTQLLFFADVLPLIRAAEPSQE